MNARFIALPAVITSLLILLVLVWNILKCKLITVDFQIDLLLFFLLPFIINEAYSKLFGLVFQGLFQIIYLLAATFILYKKCKDWMGSVFQYVVYYSLLIWAYALFASMVLLNVVYNVLIITEVINFLDRDPGNNWYYLLTGFAILVYSINGIFIKPGEFEIAKVALTIVAAIFGVLAAFSDIIKPFGLPFLSNLIINSELIKRLTIPYLSGTLVSLAIINYREFRNGQKNLNNDKIKQ